MYDYIAKIYILAQHVCLVSQEEDVISSGAGVTDSCGYLELNLAPLEEPQMFLTAEPFLESHVSLLMKHMLMLPL